MRQIRRWLRDHRHALGLALAGILLPWLAVRVRRARRGHHVTSQQRLIARRGHSGGTNRPQPGWCGTNGTAGPHGEYEWTIEG